MLAGPAELAGKQEGAVHPSAPAFLRLEEEIINSVELISESHLRFLRVMPGTSLSCLIKLNLWFALPILGNSVFSKLQNDSKAKKARF